MNQILKEIDGIEMKSSKYKSINGIKFDVHLTTQHKRSNSMTTKVYANELPM